jgi:hypothetical protein
MSLYGLNRGFYAYASDNGTTYQVAITADDASAGSFGAAVAYGANPVYPRGWKMRHCYGISSGGVRTKIPLNSLANTIYAGSATTFTKHSVSFTVEGIIGEKRTAKS